MVLTRKSFKLEENLIWDYISKRFTRKLDRHPWQFMAHLALCRVSIAIVARCMAL